MTDKIAHWIAHHTKLVIILAAILIIPSIIGYANTFVNYDILSYLPNELDSVKGEEVLDKTFNSASAAILIAKDMPSKDTAKLKAEIEKIDGVSQALWIDSLADITIPKEMLPEEIKNVFYSQDGNETMMMIQFTSSSASENTMQAIKDVRKVAGKQCLVSGMSAIMADTKELADSEAPLYIAVAIVLALIAMSITMDSWVLPLVLLTALGTAIVYNMGTNIFMGQISYITQCIAAILQLGVTMDYSVFLIDRYNEEKVKYDDRKDAMAKAISGTFVSLMGSSLTTVFGFLALCFMSLTLGLDIGLVMAKGVVFGVITVVTLLPALILTFEKQIYRYKHKPHVPSFEKLNNALVKNRKVFVILAIVLIIPSYIAQSKVPVYYNMDKALPEDLPSIVALTNLKENFNMATTHFIIVDEKVSSKDITKMTNEIEQTDGITSAIALNKFIGSSIPNEILPDEIRDICIKDGKQLMMVNTSYTAGTDEENSQIDKLISIVKSYDDNGYITGEGALTKDLVDITARDFKITSIISIVAIFILIAIVFKSPSIPIILVASIELAILINKALSLISGQPISFIAPTVIGCVQLGATIDYAILLTTRFREEIRRGLTKENAIKVAANACDRSIFQSALVFFCATFGVYLICDISIIKGICAMLARGSIISAIVIIFMLTPILLVCEKFISKTSLSWKTIKTKKTK